MLLISVKASPPPPHAPSLPSSSTPAPAHILSPQQRHHKSLRFSHTPIVPSITSSISPLSASVLSLFLYSSFYPPPPPPSLPVHHSPALSLIFLLFSLYSITVKRMADISRTFDGNEKMTENPRAPLESPIPCQSPGFLDSFRRNATIFQEELKIYKGLVLDSKEIPCCFFYIPCFYRTFFVP